MKDFLARLKGPFGFIVVSTFLTISGLTIIIPVIPFIVSKYVSGSAVGVWVGVIIAIYAFCQFFAAPVLGAISDSIGRRPVLLISIAGSAIGYVVFGIGGALWVLILGRVIDGLTGGDIGTLYAYVADITEPQDRGRNFGILGAVGGVAFMVGPAIGGLAGQISYAAPLYFAAGVATLNFLWGYFALPESLPKSKRAKHFEWARLNPFAPFGHVFTSDALKVIFASAFLFFLAGTMMQSNVSVFLKDILSFGPAGIGTVLFLVGVMDIIAQGFLSGKLLPMFGERVMAAVGLAINGIGFLLIALVASVPAAALIYGAFIVFTLGDGLFQPAMNGIISNSAESGSQGRVQGASQGMQSIARVCGPLLAAAVYPIGASVPYLVGAAWVALGLVIIVVFMRVLPKPGEHGSAHAA